MAGDEYTDNDQPGLPLEQPNGSVNTPPRILPIGELVVQAGDSLSHPFQVIDPDVPGQTLTFRLVGDEIPAYITQQDAFFWAPSDLGESYHCGIDPGGR